MEYFWELQERDTLKWSYSRAHQTYWVQCLFVDLLWFIFFCRTEDLEVSTVSEERLQASQESLLDERGVERKVWSREAFTHETAGMGGPHMEMKSRYNALLWYFIDCYSFKNRVNVNKIWLIPKLQNYLVWCCNSSSELLL